jgi:nitrogen regulatory protein PII
MKENDDIFHLLKKAGIKMGDKFYVKGIGKLEFYKSKFARYYVELIEKADIEIMLT